MKNCTHPIFRTISIAELFNMDIPQPEMIVDPIISQESLSMIYAARGVGKTHLSLEIAYCVAHGINLFDNKWKVAKPKRVLFVDGEMPSYALKNRLTSIHNRYKKTLDHDLSSNLRIFNNDPRIQGEEFSLIDIANENSQEALTLKFAGVDLVILDNLSSLTYSGKENEADSYSKIQSWLLYLRHKKISVLLVHHAGKNGEQRGTSKREDVLDTVIKLTKVSKAENGCAFKVHFEKNRNFYGNAAKSFIAKLHEDRGWEVINSDTSDELDQRDKEIIESLVQGLERKEICEKIGIKKSGLAKRIAALKEQGHIDNKEFNEIQGFP